MKKCNMLIVLLLSTILSFGQATKLPMLNTNSIEAQQPQATMDTVTTLCLVLTNVQLGASSTMWLTKIYGSVFDFPMPTGKDIKGDSLTLKKQLIVVKNYFTSIEEEVFDPKTKKKIKQQKVQQIPSDLILIDFNNNYPRKNGR